MSITPSGRPYGALEVEADLSIDVDGTEASLRGSGQRLVLSSTHPERVWASAVGAMLPAGVGVASGPRAIGLIADGLTDAGLTLEVSGPLGRVVSLGDGVSSVLGRVTTGSRAVAPGSPVALAVVAWHGYRTAVVGGAGLGAAALALWWLRARRR